MLAAAIQSPRQASQGRHGTTTTLVERIKGHYWNIDKRRRTLFNIAFIFRDQTMLLPDQCDEALNRLYALRRAVRRAYDFLNDLHPADTERLKPYGSLTKLYTLYYQLTEIILTIAMFKPICQAVCVERIQVHMYLAHQFPQVQATYEDVPPQLWQLLAHARQMEREEGEA